MNTQSFQRDADDTIRGRDSRGRSRGRGSSKLRWLTYALAGLLLVSLVSTAPARADLNGLDGGALSEASLRDGTTVVIIWASWSPRCREIVQQANAIQQKWGSKARVVLVNFQEEPAVARGFLEGKGLQVPVYLDADGAFSKKHAVTWLPGLVVFKGGEVPYAGRFAADADATLGRFVQ